MLPYLSLGLCLFLHNYYCNYHSHINNPNTFSGVFLQDLFLSTSIHKAQGALSIVYSFTSIPSQAGYSRGASIALELDRVQASSVSSVSIMRSILHLISVIGAALAIPLRVLVPPEGRYQKCGVGPAPASLVNVTKQFLGHGQTLQTRKISVNTYLHFINDDHGQIISNASIIGQVQ